MGGVMATSQCIIGLHWWANIPLFVAVFEPIFLSIDLSVFSLAYSCSLWLTHRLTLAPNPALAGALRGSLWLFMALSGSFWLTLWPLCHSLAHFCSYCSYFSSTVFARLSSHADTLFPSLSWWKICFALRLWFVMNCKFVSMQSEIHLPTNSWLDAKMLGRRRTDHNCGHHTDQESLGHYHFRRHCKVSGLWDELYL